MINQWVSPKKLWGSVFKQVGKDKKQPKKDKNYTRRVRTTK